MIRLELTTEEAADLAALLEVSLGELSYEVAASDSAPFRARLVERRGHLATVAKQLKERRGQALEGRPSSLSP